MASQSISQTETHTRFLSVVFWILLVLAYAIIFRLFGESQFAPAVQRALINVVPAALLAFPVFYFILNYVIDRQVWRQAAIHIFSACVFSTLWYIGIQTGYGLQKGWVTEGISGRAFSGVALTWQLFQGVIFYMIVAVFTYARTYRLRLAHAEAEIAILKAQISPPKEAQEKLIVKIGKELRSIAIGDIFTLSGAGDYTEVFTRNGQYLSSTSLLEFQTRLSEKEYLRVHRSHIVRMDDVLSFENAGNGRLSLHMPNGVSIVTSRAGRKAFLERSV